MIVQSAVTFSRITLNSTNVPSLRIMLRPCFDGGGMAGCFDIDVAAITFCQIAHLLRRVLGLRVDAYIRATAFGDFDPVVAQIERDDGQRPLSSLPRPPSQSKGSAPGNDHRVLVLDVSALDSVNGTGQRLNEDSMMERDRFRAPCNSKPRREKACTSARTRTCAGESHKCRGPRTSNTGRACNTGIARKARSAR